MVGRKVLDGPIWAQVWGRVGAAAIIGVLGVLYIVVTALEERTEPDTAVPLLERILTVAYADALEDELGDGPPVIRIDRDLVFVENVSREQASAAGAGVVASQLAGARAQQLYGEGFPAPAGRMTSTGFPRDLLEQLTERQHERMGTARLAAMVAVGTALAVGLLAGWGSVGSFFSVPGAGLVVAFVLGRVVTSIATLMLEGTHELSGHYQRFIREAMFEAERPVLFGGIALVIAGFLLEQVLGRFTIVDDGHPAEAGTNGSAAGESDDWSKEPDELRPPPPAPDEDRRPPPPSAPADDRPPPPPHTSPTSTGTANLP